MEEKFHPVYTEPLYRYETVFDTEFLFTRHTMFSGAVAGYLCTKSDFNPLNGFRENVFYGLVTRDARSMTVFKLLTVSSKAKKKLM